MLKLVTGAIATVAFVIILVGSAVGGVISAIFGGGNALSQPSPTAIVDIPADHLALYQQAATVCPGLDWTILAAIGKIETNHGRSNLLGVHDGENAAGAAGDMQFLEATFDAVIARHPLPPGGANPPSRYNAHDAIYAAARMLCDDGAGRGDLTGAIFAYNHSASYVNDVLTIAQAYRAAPSPGLSSGGWVIPVHGECTSGFGPRGSEFHQGQDIAAPIGTLILAASGGTVIDSGPASGYGLWVRIQHPGGVVTIYGHNNVNLVQKGQMVQAGQPIAEVGDRGESTGSHLHFQVDINSQPVDPDRFYEQGLASPLCGQLLRITP